MDGTCKVGGLYIVSYIQMGIIASCLYNVDDNMQPDSDRPNPWEEENGIYGIMVSSFYHLSIFLFKVLTVLSTWSSLAKCNEFFSTL